jgi:hypothetical protein
VGVLEPRTELCGELFLARTSARRLAPAHAELCPRELRCFRRGANGTNSAEQRGSNDSRNFCDGDRRVVPQDPVEAQ